MKDIFIRVWDLESQKYTVSVFEGERIESLASENAPAGFPPDGIKASFLYRGKKYWSTDEKEHIVNMLNEG